MLRGKSNSLSAERMSPSPASNPVPVPGAESPDGAAPVTKTPAQPLRAPGFVAFLVTQFLGAYNDNLFKLLICLLVMRLYGGGRESQVYLPLAGAMLTIPFLTFSAWAGRVADHFRTKRVMIGAKIAEILIMAAGFAAFQMQSPRLLLALLFLMGTQSAFFGPAKYGFLPETLPPEWLSRGNGQVQMWTFLAIIFGTASAGGLAHLAGDNIHWAALACIAVAVAGTITSLAITPTPRKTPAGGEHSRQPSIWNTLATMFRHRILGRSLAGSAYFWFLAALFQLNILLYAQSEMEASELLVGILQATVALGIGVGSEWAGKISGERIEFRLVPLGAAGIAGFALLLFLVPGSSALVMASLAGLGVSAGFFNLPLATAIQHHSPAERRGRCLGANNFVNFSAMTLAAAFLALALLPAWVRPGHIFLLSGISAALVPLLIFHRAPDFLSRFAMWFVPAPLYRFRTMGPGHIPETGGALLVCNHISFADAPAVQSVTPRPIRFLIHKSYYERPFFHFFSSRLRCIPVASEDRPKELIASLRTATEAIRDGDLVCIFPEAMISRLGVLLPFRRGIELIMRRLDAPIIPVALGGLLEDQSSFRWGPPRKHALRRLLRRPLRRPVAVHIGEALPGDTPSWAVRERVAELLVAADAAVLPPLPPPAELLLRRAVAGRGENGDLPETPRHLRARAVAALATARQLRESLIGQDRVALNPDCDWVRASDALALLGKTIGGGSEPAPFRLGPNDLPAPGWFRRLGAAVALDLLPRHSILRRFANPGDPQPLHRNAAGNLKPAQASEAARRIAHAFRLGPEDTVACTAAVPLAAWLPLVCGCRLTQPDQPATVLIGTPETLAQAPARTWRRVVAVAADPAEFPASLSQRFDQPPLALILDGNRLWPLLAELPDASDDTVQQNGRQPGTHGLALPGTVIRAVDANGQHLPPGQEGTLELLEATGNRPIGRGQLDASGFVTRR